MTGSKWVTKQTYKTQNAYKTDITIGYTKEWYENAKSTWRIYIPQSPQGLAFTQKVTMTVARKYQPPIDTGRYKTQFPPEHPATPFRGDERIKGERGQ